MHAFASVANAQPFRSAHLRKLTIALALTVMTSMVPGALAHAEPVDPGVRCAAQTGPGSYEFFLPGERAVDKDGNKWVCGPDGKWFRDYSALQLPTTTTTRPALSRALAAQILAPVAVATR